MCLFALLKLGNVHLPCGPFWLMLKLLKIPVLLKDQNWLPQVGIIYNVTCASTALTQTSNFDDKIFAFWLFSWNLLGFVGGSSPSPNSFYMF